MARRKTSSKWNLPEKDFTFQLDLVEDQEAPSGARVSLNVEEILGQISAYYESSKDAMGTIDLMLDYFEKLLSLSQCVKDVKRGDFAAIEMLIAGVLENIELVEGEETWKWSSRQKVVSLIKILEGLE